MRHYEIVETALNYSHDVFIKFIYFYFTNIIIIIFKYIYKVTYYIFIKSNPRLATVLII